MTLAPILTYHAVGRPLDERFRPWVVPSSLLSEHLACMVESGYELIGLTEWASRKNDPKCAVLTFDDGYADFIENAQPILASYKARCTAYVVTGYVGGQAQWLPFKGERSRPIMTWDDLRALQSYGMEIGSHGDRHIELDAVPPSAAENDIQRSRDALRQEGFSPSSFCYPFGYANRKVRDIVARAGFTNACIVGRGLADSEQDMLRVRRLFIDQSITPEELLRRFTGPALTPAARLREAAQPTWRLTRRARSVARGRMLAEVNQ